MRILVVEDTPTIQVLLAAVIRKWGHEVRVEGDGRAAIAAFESWQPDLLLLDVMLPGLSGYEVAREIRRSQNAWRPIIFLTSCVSDEEVASGVSAGGDDYLSKPVSMVVLNAKITAMERIARIQSELLATRAELARTVKSLEEMAFLDGLTGLPNRRQLERKLEEEVRRSRRAKTPLSLIMIDVDRFKSYNDGAGHVAGDQSLRQIGQVLSSSLRRAGDMAARFGGEEFLVILPDTPLPGALVVAEGLRGGVEKLNISHPAGGYLTISLGVSTATSGLLTTDALLGAADAALYEAKSSGKNTKCSRQPTFV